MVHLFNWSMSLPPVSCWLEVGYVIWPQRKGTGNCSPVVCLRGKLNRFSKHIDYLCLSLLSLWSPTTYFIVPPTYRIYPSHLQGRQLKSYPLLVPSLKSRVSRRCMVLPIQFGCGIIGPIIWEPKLII